MTDASQWQTQVGEAWADEWRRTDRTFADLSRHLDAAILEVAPDTGLALDIGCGAGATSLALARARPTLAVAGIDLSAALIAVAAERARCFANARFQVGDVGDPPASIRRGSHDLAVSRHGVMFFADPAAAFAAIRGVLRPGAPFVFSCFRSPAENPWAGDVAAAIGVAPPPADGSEPGPFAFADPDRVAGILRDSRWSSAPPPRAIDYRYVAGTGDDPVGDALSFFTRIGPAARALATLADAERLAALDRLRALLGRHVLGGAVDFPAAAWIWSATA